jgi:HK97 family phage prohead protease
MAVKTRTPRIATIGGLERRTYSGATLTADDGLEYRVSGYASTFDEPYDMGSYTETIDRGAFTTTLAARPDVQLLVNHGGLPIGRTTVPPGQPGHLSLTEDSRGLRIDAELDRSDPDVRAVVSKIRSGLLSDMSFAFRVTKQTWNSDGTQRTIEAVSLARGDVSIVNFGANPTTSVAARSRQNGRPTGLNLYQARARALALGEGRRR